MMDVRLSVSTCFCVIPKDHWQIIRPTAEWQTMKTALQKDEFAIATDLYFVSVSKL
jgi:hypothetical protein